MLDIVKLLIKAGAGGDGRVSFRREKFVPKGGPDGGHGGDGGSVFIRAKTGLTTLGEYMGKKEIVARAGQMGGKRQRTGAQAESITMEVPIGTTVWLLAQNQPQPARKYQVIKAGEPYEAAEPSQWLDANGELLEDVNEVLFQPLKNTNVRDIPKRELVRLTEDGQTIELVHGGKGGRGNESFKGPALTTPFIAEYGVEGEAKCVILELKLLADVGLVGLPNAGKSTLLSVLTKARPKIAEYPFTTLEPHLGVLRLGQQDEVRELVLADIPGLIEGASQGKGLGLEFLRHVENCRTLLMVLYVPDTFLTDPDGAAAAVWEQYQTVSRELAEYSPELAEKRRFLILNKTDLYQKTVLDSVVSLFKHKGETLMPLSGATQQGLDELKVVLSQP